MTQDGETAAVVTIHAVARRAGGSTATVSRVLTGSASASEPTRAKVLAAAREPDYTPPAWSRPWVAARHDVLGLVLSDLAGFYCSELVMGHESAAAGLGQSVALVVTRDRDDACQAVRSLAGRVDGTVLFVPTIGPIVHVVLPKLTVGGPVTDH
jgi:DNA-binding LacI/PurR family transcriptional regulator